MELYRRKSHSIYKPLTLQPTKVSAVPSVRLRNSPPFGTSHHHHHSHFHDNWSCRFTIRCTERDIADKFIITCHIFLFYIFWGKEFINNSGETLWTSDINGVAFFTLVMFLGGGVMIGIYNLTLPSLLTAPNSNANINIDITPPPVDNVYWLDSSRFSIVFIGYETLRNVKKLFAHRTATRETSYHLVTVTISFGNTNEAINFRYLRWHLVSIWGKLVILNHISPTQPVLSITGSLLYED